MLALLWALSWSSAVNHCQRRDSEVAGPLDCLSVATILLCMLCLFLMSGSYLWFALLLQLYQSCFLSEEWLHMLRSDEALPFWWKGLCLCCCSEFPHLWSLEFDHLSSKWFWVLVYPEEKKRDFFFLICRVSIINSTLQFVFLQANICSYLCGLVAPFPEDDI